MSKMFAQHEQSACTTSCEDAAHHYSGDMIKLHNFTPRGIPGSGLHQTGTPPDSLKRAFLFLSFVSSVL
jgi:hypothetical protein